MTRRIAVLGAGIQGACAGLLLARRGSTVDLFDQEPAPLMRASRWNEGKIHLGFVFARDPSARTALAMLQGSLHFADILEELTGRPLDDAVLSERFTYIVHRGGMMAPEEVRAHFRLVADRYRDLRRSLGKRYLGERSDFVFEEIARRELPEAYDAARCAAAFRTVERSVDPGIVARRLADAVGACPGLQFLGSRRIERLSRDAAGRFLVHEAGTGSRHGPYDHVVNALWEDRLRIDAGLGIEPGRAWLHRYKLAIHAEGAGGVAPSTTIMLGSFGDVVNFGDGRYYLSWYPSCRIGTSTLLAPPDFEADVTDGMRRRILKETLAGLATVVPAVAELDLARARVEVRGGYIFAWGESDIEDRGSELHNRFDIGVRSAGNHHSIDTGKYCMAPLFARTVTERICG
ncbi:MAG: FAD-dependent oxidoreductase [Pseudomonadota bacterium]